MTYSEIYIYSYDNRITEYDLSKKCDRIINTKKVRREIKS